MLYGYFFLLLSIFEEVIKNCVHPSAAERGATTHSSRKAERGANALMIISLNPFDFFFSTITEMKASFGVTKLKLYLFYKIVEFQPMVLAPERF
jgi:hypothetical protein